jgi:hypothetical protein
MDTRAAITGTEAGTVVIEVVVVVTEAGMAEADVAVGAIAKRNPIRSPGGISSAVLLL